MDLTVITTILNEPYLEQTLRSIWRACDGDQPEILVVEDGAQQLPRPNLEGVRFEQPWTEPRGCMAARDWGLVEASHDACVIVDAHMDFDAGLFVAFAERLFENPSAILCARCQRLDPSRWTGDDTLRYGAWVVWRGGAKATIPLELSWQYDEPRNDELSAVLGACYGMSRRRYVGQLRRPWSFGTGWGTDEQLLSIVNWLCGGPNRVMPYNARHWFRPEGQPHPGGPEIAAFGRWSNRIRLLRLLPMPLQWRRELQMIAYENEFVRVLSPYIELQLAEQDVEGYRNFLATQDRTFEEWRQDWCLDRDPRVGTAFDGERLRP